MDGYAVIDLETTGFAYNGTDRVCEIGVVLMGPDGSREGSYGTLVNPGRDLGAQHIHRISAADARVAPTFEAIVGNLTDLLTGRVIVAHNSAFDTAFLVAEYGRAGWPLNLTRDMTLCTMRLARDFGGPAKLNECCAHFGVSLTDAHHALADAEAAAGLLEVYMRQTRDNSLWSNWIAFGSTIRWPAPPRQSVSPVPRGAAIHGSTQLADIAKSFLLADGPAGIPGSDEYLDLLDVDDGISCSGV